MSLGAHPRLDARASAALDAVRGLAALLVMASHVRALFFVDYGGAGAHGPLAALAYFLTGLGHAAVVVFFVLSGFVIAASVRRAYGEGRWGWGSYLLDRLTRLEVVLLPALALTWVLDQAGSTLFAAGHVYQGVASNRLVLGYDVLARDGAGVAIANALFLQEIVAPPMGSNNPLWSLSYEFWYYLMFPLGWQAVASPGARAKAIGLAGLLACMAFISPAIRLDFPLWLAGAAVALAPPMASRGLAAALAGAGGAGAVAVLAYARLLHPTSQAATDYALAGAIALLVYGLARRPRRDHAPGWSGVAHALAGCSYSLYLVHLPALVFVQAWLIDPAAGRWPADAPHALAGLAIAALALAYGWGFSRLTEARTGAVRRAIAAWPPARVLLAGEGKRML